MKKMIIGFAVIAFALTACEKSADFVGKDIEGSYIGTLTKENYLKSILDEGPGDSAITDITDMGDSMIEVHCYGNLLDTTLLLNYYNHNDSVMVCFAGEEFENAYGHGLGMGHMGGLMGDRQSGQTDWMHHMSDEHDDDDEHFGGFNMTNHSFDFTFHTDHGSYHFQGIKE